MNFPFALALCSQRSTTNALRSRKIYSFEWRDFKRYRTQFLYCRHIRSLQIDKIRLDLKPPDFISPTESGSGCSEAASSSFLNEWSTVGVTQLPWKLRRGQGMSVCLSAKHKVEWQQQLPYYKTSVHNLHFYMHVHKVTWLIIELNVHKQVPCAMVNANFGRECVKFVGNKQWKDLTFWSHYKHGRLLDNQKQTFGALPPLECHRSLI